MGRQSHPKVEDPLTKEGWWLAEQVGGEGRKGEKKPQRQRLALSVAGTHLVAVSEGFFLKTEPNSPGSQTYVPKQLRYHLLQEALPLAHTYTYMVAVAQSLPEGETFILLPVPALSTCPSKNSGNAKC